MRRSAPNAPGRYSIGEIASEIRALREQHGLTQAELAHILRLGNNTISRWEAGRNLQSAAMDVLLRLIRDLPAASNTCANMRREHALLAENGVTCKVALKRSREGYAVWVPELPGANSQETTVAEAVEHIRGAIGEVLAIRRERGWD